MAILSTNIPSAQSQHYTFKPSELYDSWGVCIYSADLIKKKIITFIAKENLQYNEIQKILADCVAEPSNVVNHLETRITKLKAYRYNKVEWGLSKGEIIRARTAMKDKKSTEQEFQVSKVTPDYQGLLTSQLDTLEIILREQENSAALFGCF